MDCRILVKKSCRILVKKPGEGLTHISQEL